MHWLLLLLFTKTSLGIFFVELRKGKSFRGTESQILLVFHEKESIKYVGAKTYGIY